MTSQDWCMCVSSSSRKLQEEWEWRRRIIIFHHLSSSNNQIYGCVPSKAPEANLSHTCDMCNRCSNFTQAAHLVKIAGIILCHLHHVSLAFAPFIILEELGATSLALSSRSQQWIRNPQYDSAKSVNQRMQRTVDARTPTIQPRFGRYSTQQWCAVWIPIIVPTVTDVRRQIKLVNIMIGRESWFHFWMNVFIDFCAVLGFMMWLTCEILFSIFMSEWIIIIIIIHNYSGVLKLYVTEKHVAASAGMDLLFDSVGDLHWNTSSSITSISGSGTGGWGCSETQRSWRRWW